MGMTIDETIKVIRKMLAYTDLRARENLHADMVDACEMAIDTMRKYQKIQEIVRWNNAPSPYYKPDGQLFREIREVLEDGND